MHFLIPTPAYGPAYLLRIFHYDPVLKHWVCPPSGSGPAYIRSDFYCCNYALKPDGRRANHIIVEKS